MKITAELIERFFNKQCTAEQARYVAVYLKENPDRLDSYFNINEWNSSELNELMRDEHCDEVWKKIKRKQKQSALIVLLKRSAVAAGVIGVICSAYSYLFYTEKKSAAKSVVTKSIAFTEPEHRITTNLSKHNIKVVLVDGSVVSLWPGAVIKYDVPFHDNKRNILLTGQAMFNVAKDKTKPFTVSAGSLSTTALGTRFKITTGKNAANTTVKLFSGKVVIRSIQPGLRGWTNDIYLQPGEQMKYDAEKMYVDVNKIKINSPVNKPAIKTAAAEAMAAATDELSFDGAPLPDVIDKLAKFYSVKVEFNKTELAALSFSGTINKKDSLTNILQLIGQMNNLRIIKETDKLIVQKIKDE